MTLQSIISNLVLFLVHYQSYRFSVEVRITIMRQYRQGFCAYLNCQEIYK